MRGMTTSDVHLCGEYRLGMGSGRFSVCDFHAKMTARIAVKAAAVFKVACSVFCCCLHSSSVMFASCVSP